MCPSFVQLLVEMPLKTPRSVTRPRTKMGGLPVRLEARNCMAMSSQLRFASTYSLCLVFGVWGWRWWWSVWGAEECMYPYA